MSFASGVQAGLGIVEGFNRNYDRARKSAVNKEIGKALNTPVDWEEDAYEVPTQQQTAAAGQMAAPAAELPASGFVPPANANVLKSPEPLGERSMAASQIGGLDMSRVGQMAAPQNNDAAMAPAEAPAPQASRTTVKAPHPIDQALRYERAAAIAARAGNLELQEAYTNSADAARRVGVTKSALAAIQGLEAGDPKGVEYFMRRVVPNGTRYSDFKMSPDGKSIVGAVSGEGGKKSPYKVDVNEIISVANSLLAKDGSLESLVNARAAADKERWTREDKEIGRGIEQQNADANTRRAEAMEMRAMGLGPVGSGTGSRGGKKDGGADLTTYADELKAMGPEAEALDVNRRRVYANMRANYPDASPEEQAQMVQALAQPEVATKVGFSSDGRPSLVLEFGGKRFDVQRGIKDPIAEIKARFAPEDADDAEPLIADYAQQVRGQFERFLGPDAAESFLRKTPAQRKPYLEKLAARGVPIQNLGRLLVPDVESRLFEAQASPTAPVNPNAKVPMGDGRTYDPRAKAQAAGMANAERFQQKAPAAQQVIQEAQRAGLYLPGVSR